MTTKVDRHGVPFRVGQRVVWRDACCGPIYGIIVDSVDIIYGGQPHVSAKVRTISGKMSNVNLYLTEQFEVVGASFG